MKIDTAWFMSKIEESIYGSQRRLAPKLDMNQANLSRMLTGARPMRMAEAERLAKLLEVPLTEVLARAGMNLEEPEIDSLRRALRYYANGGDDGGERARRALKAQAP